MRTALNQSIFSYKLLIGPVPPVPYQNHSSFFYHTHTHVQLHYASPVALLRRRTPN